MWHPFLGSSASANDLELDEQTRVYFVTGLGPSLFECDFSTSLPIYRTNNHSSIIGFARDRAPSDSVWSC